MPPHLGLRGSPQGLSHTFVGKAGLSHHKSGQVYIPALSCKNLNVCTHTTSKSSLTPWMVASWGSMLVSMTADQEPGHAKHSGHQISHVAKIGLNLTSCVQAMWLSTECHVEAYGYFSNIV
jgi:hypothetical protein